MASENGAPLTPPVSDLVARLLQSSLAHWQIDAQLDAQMTPAGLGFRLSTRAAQWTIEPAPLGLPFRWLVYDGQRRRTAASVVGLLGIIRSALDPNYCPAVLRIGQATDQQTDAVDQG